MAVPDGWHPAKSMSQTMQHVDNYDAPKDLEFLREEVGVEVYWNKWTNKEVYVGKTGGSDPFAPRKRLN